MAGVSLPRRIAVQPSSALEARIGTVDGVTEDWTVTMGMPQGSVQLPVDSEHPEHTTDDIRAWAVDAARARLQLGATDVHVAAFTNVLLEALVDARQRAPIIAFAFCPDPAAGELARVE